MKYTMHDLVDREKIAESQSLWNSTKIRSNHPFVGKSVDECVEFWLSMAKETPAIEESLFVYTENADLLTNDSDVEIINALLNHPDKHKLRLIGDGSYYTHRIWFTADDDGTMSIVPSVRWMNSEFKRMDKQMSEMTSDEKIDMLFNSFDVVYIQMIPVSSRAEIVETIDYDLHLRKFI